jgi:hypothetical protein
MEVVGSVLDQVSSDNFIKSLKGTNGYYFVCKNKQIFFKNCYKSNVETQNPFFLNLNSIAKWLVEKVANENIDIDFKQCKKIIKFITITKLNLQNRLEKDSQDDFIYDLILVRLKLISFFYRELDRIEEILKKEVHSQKLINLVDIDCCLMAAQLSLEKKMHDLLPVCHTAILQNENLLKQIDSVFNNAVVEKDQLTVRYLLYLINKSSELIKKWEWMASIASGYIRVFKNEHTFFIHSLLFEHMNENTKRNLKSKIIDDQLTLVPGDNFTLFIIQSMFYEKSEPLSFLITVEKESFVKALSQYIMQKNVNHAGAVIKWAFINKTIDNNNFFEEVGKVMEILSQDGNFVEQNFELFLKLLCKVNPNFPQQTLINACNHNFGTYRLEDIEHYQKSWTSEFLLQALFYEILTRLETNIQAKEVNSIAALKNLATGISERVTIRLEDYFFWRNKKPISVNDVPPEFYQFINHSLRKKVDSSFLTL